jgi:hypothetical protein
MIHKHSHGCCEHCLHFCANCNITYCCKCKEEWGKSYSYYTYPYYNPPFTVTCGGTGLDTGLTSGGNIKAFTNCEHKH